MDKLEPILEEGKVFRISKARVNIAKKQFSNVKNEYEIMFDKSTEVEPVRLTLSFLSRDIVRSPVVVCFRLRTTMHRK